MKMKSKDEIVKEVKDGNMSVDGGIFWVLLLILEKLEGM